MRGGGIRYKHRKGCMLCMNMSASSPTYGWLKHPMSGMNIGLCFKHVISLCRTPKHAEEDGQPFNTEDGWRLIRMGSRKRWFPNKLEEFQLKSSGWKIVDHKWEWMGLDCSYCLPFGDECDHGNWQLVTGTHGKLPRPPKMIPGKDTEVNMEFENPNAPWPTQLPRIVKKVEQNPTK